MHAVRKARGDCVQVTAPRTTVASAMLAQRTQAERAPNLLVDSTGRISAGSTRAMRGFG